MSPFSPTKSVIPPIRTPAWVWWESDLVGQSMRWIFGVCCLCTCVSHIQVSIRCRDFGVIRTWRARILHITIYIYINVCVTFGVTRCLLKSCSVFNERCGGSHESADWTRKNQCIDPGRTERRTEEVILRSHIL